MKKDLLGLRDIETEDITRIFELASVMKTAIEQGDKKASYLKGKAIITLFYENSTRTRMSFELAGKYMSAAAANISAASSSVSKGETLIDTGRTLDMMGVDVIIMRHPMSGAPHLLSKYVRAGVINAGDGTNEHPTQALLDMFTIKQYIGRLEGLKVVILGDSLHSRVARSNCYGLAKMGAKVVLAGPSTLLPTHPEALYAQACTSVEDAVLDADVVMCLRLQRERQKCGYYPSLKEYSEFFGLNKDVMMKAKSNALIMHPGPVNRGVEITSQLVEGENSVINEQVTNGLAVRMALLRILTMRADNE